MRLRPAGPGECRRDAPIASVAALATTGQYGASVVQIKTKKVGQILVESGTVSQEKLEMALKEQRQTGEKLGAILQRLGICSEREIARVLADQAGVACISLIDLEVAPDVLAMLPAEFAEQNALLPIAHEGNRLHLAMTNPLDLDTVDQVARLTGCYIELSHAPESEIQDAILRYYGARVEDDTDIDTAIADAQRAVDSGTKLGDSDSPFIRLVDLLLRSGIESGATDIHIEPEEKILRCRYRVDGRLVQGAVLPRSLQGIVTSRLKILAELDISENRVPQDGRILYTVGSRQVDLRVSTFPTISGEAVVCRVLDKENLIVGLEYLGMDGQARSAFRRDIERPHGIVLVTGPTGSGKTTTLYAALNHLNKPDTKIITLEDPVEYELPVINQAQVNTAKGLTFATGLRAILRQDPDIVLVGEIRDRETARMAIRAALTGHLVFSTLHTNSAVGAIPRLMDMGIEPYLLAATLVSVVAQRLVRRVCRACATDHVLDEKDRARLGLTAEEFADTRMRSGSGCAQCRDTGYRGRVAVFEYLTIDTEIRQLIASGADETTIRQTAEWAGMRSLRDDALAKLRAGTTSAEEMVRVIS